MTDENAAVLVLVAAVTAMWLIFDYVDAVLSGWMEMGRRFRDRSPGFPKDKARARIRIGPGLSHGGVVTIGVDDYGLHLRMGLLARPGHPPLLFPWETVDSRGSLTWWRFWAYDTYGVGYYTTIAIPARSKAAHLLSSFLQGRSLEVQHP